LPSFCGSPVRFYHCFDDSKFICIYLKYLATLQFIKIHYTMAKVSNVLIGKASGSVGNATFSAWKGINVLKAKAVSVANPKTDKQLMHRSALKQVTAIARQLIGVIALGFKKLAVKKSAYNAFQSDALKNAFDFAAPPVATFQPDLMQVSKGSMAATALTDSSRSLADARFKLQWDLGVLGVGQSASDTPVSAAYNITKNTWGVGEQVNTRAAGIVDIAIPADSAVGDNIVLYLGFFSNVDGSSSDSVNVTGLVVA
jgi:hypothetical protein